MNTPIKFCPQHFPVGTIVQLNQEFLSIDSKREDDGVRTVVELVRNGVDSYVIKTGLKNHHSDGTAFADEGVNINYVERVLKRGDGPVKINQLYHGTNKELRKRVLADVEMMALRQPINYLGMNSAGYTEQKEWKPKKRNHNTGSVQALLMAEVMHFAPEGLMVDYPRMATALFNQTWVTHTAECVFQFSSVNKKRLRRWLRQNLNRFLLSNKTALKNEQDQHEEDMRLLDLETFEEDKMFRDRLASDAADDMEGGSCYDDSEDQNLTAPPQFKTNFGLTQLATYQKAVQKWEERYPEEKGDFEVRESALDGSQYMGSLWYYGTRQWLDEFWTLFREEQNAVKQEKHEEEVVDDAWNNSSGHGD